MEAAAEEKQKFMLKVCEPPHTKMKSSFSSILI